MSEFRKFTILPAGNRHEVIDERGRTVVIRETRREAGGVAFLLNRAAAQGPEELARVVGYVR